MYKIEPGYGCAGQAHAGSGVGDVPPPGAVPSLHFRGNVAQPAVANPARSSPRQYCACIARREGAIPAHPHFPETTAWPFSPYRRHLKRALRSRPLSFLPPAPELRFRRWIAVAHRLQRRTPHRRSGQYRPLDHRSSDKITAAVVPLPPSTPVNASPAQAAASSNPHSHQPPNPAARRFLPGNVDTRSRRCG
jgi:hypothetical protein